MEQLTLPDPGENRDGAHHSDAGDTELAAAKAVFPKTGTQRRRVLGAIAATHDRGATDWEITRILGLFRTAAGARRNELMHDGWVEDSGVRRVDEESGMAGIVWVLSEAGRLAWRGVA